MGHTLFKNGLGSPIPTASNEPSKSSPWPWEIHHDAFRAIIGPNPTLSRIFSIEAYPFAHKACVFFPDTDDLFITSNLVSEPAGTKRIIISKLALRNRNAPPLRQEIICSDIQMASGGVNDGASILFCGQGSMTRPSGLYRMSRAFPWDAEPVVTSFHGRPFNSVSDVVFSRDGCLWFTDPPCGHAQGFRPRPSLPTQVYRFDPKTESIRAVADGFGRPNGICFSPDESVVYITDTDQVQGDGSVDEGRASTIYAFDVTYYHDQPFLANRRLFAFAGSGIPNGIKCDMDGNVYSGCGDGVNVWSAGGLLLGKIVVAGGAANFCFGRRGEMFILNEHHVWRAQLSDAVKGALLRIEDALPS
ncbi:gluconolactonase [Thelonectria olida]|uniref:Gluconolactonase n=1 Tax=Thelonectria olida TaxID=1576542 RepID=A0A9P9ARB4_9HYPO|nr:gluconolactonase [Thelonectria olida]